MDKSEVERKMNKPPADDWWSRIGRTLGRRRGRGRERERERGRKIGSATFGVNTA